MFSHLYKNTVTHKSVSGTDSYGAAVVASSSSIDCKIKYKNRLIRNAQGVEVTAQAEIHTAEAVNIEDLITLEGRDWQVIQSSPVYDFDGNIQGYKVFI